ncbi:MAG: VCBS repeat-containing protein [Phycisphaerae bacterium]|nr:VCBS repeat-containing protein [Phycisphaerae bacterium]
MLLLSLSSRVLADVPLDHVIVDRDGPKDPWAKILGDIDGDGFTDIVVGGRRGPLVWYAYPNWSKGLITEGGYKTVDGELGDVDGDGDLDVVMGGLFWYENPRPQGDPAGRAWKTHKVANHPTHDIELGDLDGDGDLDIVTRDQSDFGHNAGDKIHLWRQEQGGKWTQKVINCPHGESIALADIDKDGDSDIVIGGIWFENERDIVNGPWSPHRFGQWHPSATVQVADINGDSRPDVVLSPSELKGQTYKMSWFEAPADPKKENWPEHVIAEPVECVIHGLVTADINGDGATDVVSSEMHQGADPDEVTVYLNRANGSSWTKQVISTKGSHYIRVADIGNDGDLDIMGANWSGDYQPIEMWENKSAARALRVPITINAAGRERLDKPVEVEMNFTQLLVRSGDEVTFNKKSMRLAEVDAAGRIIEASVRFQFDKVPDFNGQANAKGTLTFMADGQTAADSTRTFHLYLGSAEAVQVPPLVRVTDGVQHRGQESFMIESQNATYYYHKQGAGFASIVDKDGNDWLGYRPGGGPAGEYRGIPNMGHPEGYCHPGKTVSSSKIISGGPIKVSIFSESDDGKMQCVWDIFPSYARLTVLKMRKPYWFLYEGTPGGKLDEDSDYCIRADTPGGTRTPASVKWDGDLSVQRGAGEWLCFGDGSRVLYLVHHEDDEAVDSYWPMRGEMTVFGFGRKGINKFMEATPAHFTIGLCEGSTYADVARVVDSAYAPLSVAIGNPEIVGE